MCKLQSWSLAYDKHLISISYCLLPIFPTIAIYRELIIKTLYLYTQLIKVKMEVKIVGERIVIGPEIRLLL